MHLNPAEYVVKTIGGVRATARLVGRSPSCVSKWRYPREEGGAEGNIPSLAQRIILREAKILGLDITPNDLAFGREVEEGPDESQTP